MTTNMHTHLTTNNHQDLYLPYVAYFRHLLFWYLSLRLKIDTNSTDKTWILQVNNKEWEKRWLSLILNGTRRLSNWLLHWQNWPLWLGSFIIQQFHFLGTTIPTWSSYHFQIFRLSRKHWDKWLWSFQQWINGTLKKCYREKYITGMLTEKSTVEFLLFPFYFLLIQLASSQVNIPYFILVNCEA
jgi:hypothetical protein